MAALLLGGAFLLRFADAQARDTIRKHHLEDLEQALYFARNVHGTYPPYDQPTWCGLLSDPANATVRADVEAALRQQNEKYGNEQKPFPVDPTYTTGAQGYFYWKHSPALFELYATLEADRTGERSTARCQSAETMNYDYGLNSGNREDRSRSFL